MIGQMGINSFMPVHTLKLEEFSWLGGISYFYKHDDCPYCKTYHSQNFTEFEIRVGEQRVKCRNCNAEAIINLTKEQVEMLEEEGREFEKRISEMR